MRRPRNTLLGGLVGLGAIAALIYGAFNAQSLPLIGGGTTYRAQFTEAGGLRVTDEVRVAGVKIGKVESIELTGDHVTVAFRVTDDKLRLGTKTGAAIKIKTLLGRKFLALEPSGPGRLDPKTEIPRDRTVAPYDVVEAFSDLTLTTEKIDTAQLAKALETLTTTFENTPDEVKASLDGLGRLSKVIAERDGKLRTLLSRSSTVTRVLSDRNTELIKLVKDGDLLLKEIRQRRALIHQLLVNSQSLSKQVRGLISDNEKQLAPALKRLDSVVKLLRKNQKDLDKSIEGLAPFVRVFANTLGTGPWFDTYIPNLVPLPAVPRLPATGQSGGN